MFIKYFTKITDCDIIDKKLTNSKEEITWL